MGKTRGANLAASPSLKLIIKAYVPPTFVRRDDFHADGYPIWHSLMDVFRPAYQNVNR